MGRPLKSRSVRRAWMRLSLSYAERSWSAAPKNGCTGDFVRSRPPESDRAWLRRSPLVYAARFCRNARVALLGVLPEGQLRLNRGRQARVVGGDEYLRARWRVLKLDHREADRLASEHGRQRAAGDRAHRVALGRLGGPDVRPGDGLARLAQAGAGLRLIEPERHKPPLGVAARFHSGDDL